MDKLKLFIVSLISVIVILVQPLNYINPLSQPEEANYKRLINMTEQELFRQLDEDSISRVNISDSLLKKNRDIAVLEAEKYISAFIIFQTAQVFMLEVAAASSMEKQGTVPNELLGSFESVRSFLYDMSLSLSLIPEMGFYKGTVEELVAGLDARMNFSDYSMVSEDSFKVSLSQLQARAALVTREVSSQNSAGFWIRVLELIFFCMLCVAYSKRVKPLN